MGLSVQQAHDQRYDAADEFMEVVYRLWQGSWEDDEWPTRTRSHLPIRRRCTPFGSRERTTASIDPYAIVEIAPYPSRWVLCIETGVLFSLGLG